jgi:hypothetical protein
VKPTPCRIGLILCLVRRPTTAYPLFVNHYPLSSTPLRTPCLGHFPPPSAPPLRSSPPRASVFPSSPAPGRPSNPPPLTRSHRLICTGASDSRPQPASRPQPYRQAVPGDLGNKQQELLNIATSMHDVSPRLFSFCRWVQCCGGGALAERYAVAQCALSVAAHLQPVAVQSQSSTRSDGPRVAYM